MERIKRAGPFVEGRSAGFLACFSLVLAMGLWPLGWWDASTPLPSNRPVETDWIEFVSTGHGAVLLAFDHPPAEAEILDLFQLSTPSEISAGKFHTPARLVFHARRGEVDVRPLSGAAALALGQKMDLNRTSARDLALLPGIGPAIAQRIVAERDERGDFTSTEDLTRVRGIGPATIEKILPMVCINHQDPG